MDIEEYIARDRAFNEHKIREFLRTNKIPSEKKQKRRNVVQLVGFSIMVYVGAGIAVGFAHELGHASICASEGLHYRIGISDRGLYVICSGAVERSQISHLAGPLAGLALAGTLAAIGKRFWVPLLISGLAYIVDQAMKIGVEGFMNPLYRSGEIDMLMTAVQGGSLALLIVYFAKRQHSYMQDSGGKT